MFLFFSIPISSLSMLIQCTPCCPPQRRGREGRRPHHTHLVHYVVHAERTHPVLVRDAPVVVNVDTLVELLHLPRLQWVPHRAVHRRHTAHKVLEAQDARVLLVHHAEGVVEAQATADEHVLKLLHDLELPQRVLLRGVLALRVVVVDVLHNARDLDVPLEIAVEEREKLEELLVADGDAEVVEDPLELPKRQNCFVPQLRVERRAASVQRRGQLGDDNLFELPRPAHHEPVLVAREELGVVDAGVGVGVDEEHPQEEPRHLEAEHGAHGVDPLDLPDGALLRDVHVVEVLEQLVSLDEDKLPDVLENVVHRACRGRRR
eukprot:PhM_4_TR3161/c0_g1_i1/m.62725